MARHGPLRLALAVTAATIVLAAGWLGFVWPPPSWWRTHYPAETAFMAMRERQVTRPAPREYLPVPLSSMSQWLPRAAVAAEDDAFYSHRGIDWHALRQALGYRRSGFEWSSERDRAELRRAMGSAASRTDRLRGASTITQQLAKNLYLSPSRNPLRKVKEAAIAYRLEWALSKDRILDLYLNVAELGPGVWGVEAASRRYFERGSDRISLEQAALLVGTLPHPLSSNPARRPGRARWRQQLILRRLRGEDVELPPDAGDEKPPPAVELPAADSTSPGPVLPDTAPRDSLPPAPVPPDSVNPPGAAA